MQRNWLIDIWHCPKLFLLVVILFQEHFMLLVSFGSVWHLTPFLFFVDALQMMRSILYWFSRAAPHCKSRWFWRISLLKSAETTICQISPRWSILMRPTFDWLSTINPPKKRWFMLRSIMIIMTWCVLFSCIKGANVCPSPQVKEVRAVVSATPSSTLSASASFSVVTVTVATVNTAPAASVTCVATSVRTRMSARLQEYCEEDDEMAELQPTFTGPIIK